MKKEKRIRQHKLQQAKEKRAFELKRVLQSRSSEEKIRLCNKYIYELYHKENENKEAARFCELEQKEYNELKLIKENDPQYVRELSSEEKERKMDGEQIEKEEDEEEEEFDPEVVPFITQIENQYFYNQKDLKPKYYQARVDTNFQEVKHELNQNIRIEQSLSEMKY